jgi:hypothetical protein
MSKEFPVGKMAIMGVLGEDDLAQMIDAVNRES